MSFISFLIIYMPYCVALLAGLVNFRNLNTAFRWLLGYVLFAVAINIVGQVMVFNYSTPGKIYNNLWIMNLSQFGFFWILSYIAGLLLKKQLFLKLAIGCCVIHFVIWCINLYLMGWDSFFNWSFLLACIAVSSYFLHVLQKIIVQEEAPLHEQAVFWLCIAILVYHMCAIPYWAFANYLNKFHLFLSRKLFNIILGLSAIMYLLIAVSLWCCRRNVIIETDTK